MENTEPYINHRIRNRVWRGKLERGIICFMYIGAVDDKDYLYFGAYWICSFFELALVQHLRMNKDVWDDKSLTELRNAKYVVYSITRRGYIFNTLVYPSIFPLNIFEFYNSLSVFYPSYFSIIKIIYKSRKNSTWKNKNVHVSSVVDIETHIHHQVIMKM